ncbi:MAG: hypothetical protein NTX52_04800 [Planctomycetota bacterium]|nr:hypothetical protein [Planctomycetota bacterium]
MHLIDLLVIIIYIAVTVTIGLKNRGRQENAEDFFTASGGMRSHLQSIMVGFSVAAALFSGISFLMYPSIVFGKGISVIFGLTAFPIGWIILKYWFLPHFLSLGIKHPYDIIEMKFGPHIRTLTAFLYAGLRIMWMAILIYAPTVAVLAAAGLSNEWRWPIILMLGLGSTIYTVFGGIRGVIVTDAIQFVIIGVGILITMGFILAKLPASFGEMYNVMQQKGVFHLNFAFDMKAELGFWSVVLGSAVGNIANWMSDQMSLQRYLANGEVKAACKSTFYNLVGSFIVVLLLVAVGLSLYAWFYFSPDPNMPSDQDKVFPYFIANKLPVGVAGLLLAALLAATITSMTGGVNTLAATITFDFRIRYGSILTGRQQLRFGRNVSLVVGTLATIIAGFIGDLGTIFQMAQFILGLFAGPIFVCVLLSVTKIPVNRIAMGVAMIVGFAAGFYVRQYLGWYDLWTSPVTFAVTFLAALILTPIFGGQKVSSPVRACFSYTL